MKSKTILFLILVLNSIILCNNPRQNEEFYIELPGNWIQIPRQAVNFLVKELNRPAVIDLDFEKYDYLYQFKSNDTLFTLPYMLIQVHNYRRLSKSELMDTKNFTYDKATGYLWSETDSTINVIIPTEKGTINIYAVSDLRNSVTNKPVLQKMIKSIIVAHDLKYKDDFIHNTPILRDVVKRENLSNIIIITFVIVVLAARIYNRKFSSK